MAVLVVLILCAICIYMAIKNGWCESEESKERKRSKNAVEAEEVMAEALSQKKRGGVFADDAEDPLLSEKTLLLW